MKFISCIQIKLMKTKLIAFFLLFTAFSFSQTDSEKEELKILFDAGEFEQVAEKGLKYLKLDVDRETAQWTGYSLHRIGKSQEGYNILNAATSAFPKSAEVFYLRAEVLRETGNINDALGDYTKSILRADTDSIQMRARKGRAVTNMMVRQFETAYEDLQLCYEKDSLDMEVLSNLSVICNELDKSDEKYLYLDKAMQVEVDSYLLIGNYGYFLQQDGKYEESIEKFNNGLKLQPNDPFLLCNKAFSTHMLGSNDEALDLINKSLKGNDQNSYAYMVRADIYLALGKTKKSCKDWEKALSYGYTREYGNKVQEMVDKYCK